jgi:RNA polymerase sigma-70 factor, ECF subfamily
MSLLADDDPAAFEMIFDRHGTVAYSLAYRVCGQPSVAEEIVQEAFLSLWRSRARYDPARGCVRSWLLRFVHNRAIDALRRIRAGVADLAPDPGLADGQPGPELTESLLVGREEARWVRQALDDLPNEQRHVIELAYFVGLTQVEIAQRLELPVGTVKSRMRLGMHKLRVALEAPSHREMGNSADAPAMRLGQDPGRHREEVASSCLQSP